MSVLTIDVQCNPDNAEEKRRPAMGRGPAGERGRPIKMCGKNGDPWEEDTWPLDPWEREMD
jgi:hypothetical protein